MSINYPTLAHFRHFSHFRHSSNYNIFPIHSIMQNKPNFPYFSPENEDYAKKQTQFKPNQSQFVERPKMNSFAWIRSLTIVLIILLAAFSALKGANLNTMSKPLLGAKPLQAQSAKMAQKLTSSNHQNNTQENYNLLQTNMLNSLNRHNPPTGTPFAYLRPRR